MKRIALTVTIALAAATVATVATVATTVSATTATTVAPPTARSASQGKPATVTLVTHDSFVTSKGIFDALAKDGIKVKVLSGGDAGELVNKAILTKDAPLGDVLWGVDNTFLSRATNAGIFDPYVPRGMRDVDPRFRAMVPGGIATPVDFGDVCVNYDKAALRKRKVAPPRTLDDLAKPAYKGMLVVQNPATSSPGLAFLLGTVARYGNGWQRYWSKLNDNGVKVVNGWTEAYNSEFSGAGGGGRRPLVVSYGSSPPAAVLFGADPNAEVSPIGVSEETCFRQVEFAGILKGTKRRVQAERLVDFLVSRPFQEDMPLNMFVFPVTKGAALPEAFTRFAVVPKQPLTMTSSRIAEGRDRWIEEWTNLLLR